MREKKKFLIFSGAFIGLLILYLAFFQEDSKRFDWGEDYVLDKDKPYGTWLITELLKEYDAERKFTIPSTPVDRSLKNWEKNTNYVFIGEEIFLDNIAADSLVSYVQRGNKAFIFTRSFPKEIIKRTRSVFDIDSSFHSYSFFYGDSAETWIEVEKEEKRAYFSIPYRNRFKSSSYDWNFFDGGFNAHDYKALGYFLAYNENEMINEVNFYRIDYGKGSFYFHTQPVIFTNIVLKEDKVLTYTNKVFTYLNKGPIIWEEHNWRFNKPNKKTWLFKPQFFQKKESPLKLILSSPSLKWAWYLLLLFILIFILFNGKRRKGIIKMLPNKKNTSLAQIKTLSNLYSIKKDRYTIAAKIFENLLWYLQTELRLNINQSRDNLIKNIINKTRLPEVEVRSLFESWDKIQKNKDVGMDDFIAFNKEINNFYIRLKE